MGNKNRYAAPVSDSQSDAATTGVAATSATEAAAVDTLATNANVSASEAAGVDTLIAPETDAVQDKNALSAEELAALTTGGEPALNELSAEDIAAVEAERKAAPADEKAAADQTRTDDGVPVEEPGLPEVAAPTPAPVPEPVAASAPAPEVAPAPTPVPPPAPVVAAPAPAPVASASELSNRIEQLKKEGSAREKALITFLESYISNMAPGKPVDDKTGAANQLTLWRTLQSVVERSAGDEFRILFSLLLDIIAEHQHKRGVFYDKFVFRFAEHLTFSQGEQKSFFALINLLVLTANRNTRHVGKKQVDLARIANAGFTEQGRQNLLAFYK